MVVVVKGWRVRDPRRRMKILGRCARVMGCCARVVGRCARVLMEEARCVWEAARPERYSNLCARLQEG